MGGICKTDTGYNTWLDTSYIFPHYAGNIGDVPRLGREDNDSLYFYPTTTGDTISTAEWVRSLILAWCTSYLDSADNHIGDTATVLRTYADTQDEAYLDSADNHIGDTAVVLRAYATRRTRHTWTVRIIT